MWLRSTEETGISGNGTPPASTVTKESQTECWSTLAGKSGQGRNSWTHQRTVVARESPSLKSKERQTRPRRDRQTQRWLAWGTTQRRRSDAQTSTKGQVWAAQGLKPWEPETKGEFILARSSWQRFSGASRERQGRASSVVGVCRKNMAATSRTGKKPHLVLLEPKGASHWDKAANPITPVAAVDSREKGKNPLLCGDYERPPVSGEKKTTLLNPGLLAPSKRKDPLWGQDA